MPIATITSEGQVTIPQEILDRLGLKPGDRVGFRIHADGKCVLEPRIPIERLYGVLATGAATVTLEEMDRAILEGISERHERLRQR